MVDKVRQRLSERSISIELTERAKDWLVEEGFDPVYGARPLRRAVERHIENVVAKRILAGEYEDGDAILVDVEENVLTFTRETHELASASV